MKKFISIVLLIAFSFLVCVPSISEVIKSPNVESFYQVKSDFFQKSLALFDLEVVDMMMVDIHVDNFSGRDVIDAELEFPIVPEDLTAVILFDGWFIAHGQWDYTSGHSLHVYFWTNDLVPFGHTDGLYLVLIRKK